MAVKSVVSFAETELEFSSQCCATRSLRYSESDPGAKLPQGLIMTIASILNALLFAAVGIVAFAVGLLVVARALPGNLWKQALVDQNLNAAIVLAGIALAIGWIVASAVH